VGDLDESTIPWTVLLIGGSSCTGKTTVAAELGRRFGVPWAQVDDFRLALQRSTSPKEFRDLHFFVNEPDSLTRPPEELAAALGRVAAFMSSALEAVIESRIATQKPLILEGDGLLPSLAAIGNVAPGPSNAQPVRAVFLGEPDAMVLLNNTIERGRGEELSQEMRANAARMAALYGRWLCEEAKRQDMPVLRARPYATLASRIVAATSTP
jgi:2-phosphoglycerate kinase